MRSRLGRNQRFCIKMGYNSVATGKLSISKTFYENVHNGSTIPISDRKYPAIPYFLFITHTHTRVCN